MTDKAQWLPHGSGSRMVLDIGDLFVHAYRFTSGEVKWGALMLGCGYPDRFSTQAEAEAFAVATLRGILEDVKARLP